MAIPLSEKIIMKVVAIVMAIRGNEHNQYELTPYITKVLPRLVNINDSIYDELQFKTTLAQN